MGSARELRTLMVSGKAGLEGDGWPPREEARRLIDADRLSDILALHDALGVTVLDARYLAGLPGLWGRLLRRLPFRIAQAAEIARRRHELDAVLTWGERDAARVAALMCFLSRRPAHVSILFWISDWKKSLPLRLLQRWIDRMMIAAPLQYRFAVDTLRLPPGKVVNVPWAVDTRFWRPLPASGGGDTICAVGLELRDYATFVAALRPLEIPCHIAVGSVRETGGLDVGPLPDQVTVGRKPITELRVLYARSRFVVVPLLPSDSDQGITTCLEAMAMAKAVICTDTVGQAGVLEDGVNSVRVPPLDEPALRNAIEQLWNDPDLCERLGAAGRRLVEEQYGLDTVVPRIAALCREAAAERGRPDVLTGGS
jgi:glycosyltransferase involved in cell wall biosynthesis